MRKIIATEFITLNGVMEDPGGAEKTKYDGWSGQCPFTSDIMALLRFVLHIIYSPNKAGRK